MRKHSDEKITELKRLRRLGYSIPELVEKLSIPKTTVWHHVHNLKISPKYLSVLKSKRGGNTRRKEERWASAQDRAREILNGPHRDISLATAMLYWAEGNCNRCEFINSDGKMIELYLKALRGTFKIEEERLHFTLRLFSHRNLSKCKKYWSEITRVPPNEFIVKVNDGGTHSRTKYGMCRITVKKGGNLLKLFHSLKDSFSAEFIK